MEFDGLLVGFCMDFHEMCTHFGALGDHSRHWAASADHLGRFIRRFTGAQGSWVPAGGPGGGSPQEKKRKREKREQTIRATM